MSTEVPTNYNNNRSHRKWQWKGQNQNQMSNQNASPQNSWNTGNSLHDYVYLVPGVTSPITRLYSLSGGPLPLEAVGGTEDPSAKRKVRASPKGSWVTKAGSQPRSVPWQLGESCYSNILQRNSLWMVYHPDLWGADRAHFWEVGWVWSVCFDP